MKYRDLLLSAGGGVFAAGQSVKQASCATIAIGLGGTGIACLKDLKRKVYEQLLPDDPAAVVQKYQHIKFLAVDSDRYSLEANGEINPMDPLTEYFDISGSYIKELLSNPEILSRYPEFAWLKTAERDECHIVKRRGLNVLSADNGAGGNRQVGRFLMMQKSAAFVEKIQRLICEAKVGLPADCEVGIHIFTGMCGGTGSGIFLDVCYLIQQALKNVGEWGHAMTFGYFFMPDVNLSILELRENPSLCRWYKANGFAAMKELDYCMNFENNGDAWNQQYQGFHIGPTAAPPVMIPHLISASTTDGSALVHGFEGAINAVSDFVMQFAAKNDMTMEWYCSDYLHALANVRRAYGANNRYSLIGVSGAAVPFKEIMACLSANLFEKMQNVGRDMPTDEEINVIAKNSGLTYQQLKARLLQGTNRQVPESKTDYREFTSMSEEDIGIQGSFILPYTLIAPYQKIQEQILCRMEANLHELLQEWSWETVQNHDEKSISKVQEVYRVLAALVSEPDCGPMYAANVLNGSSRRNLIFLLHGMLVQTQEEHHHCMSIVNLRCEEVKQARTRFLHPRLLDNKKKLFAEFVVCIERYYYDDGRMKLLERMRGMLQVMLRQFEKLYAECFKPFAEVSQNLIMIFDENRNLLNHGYDVPVLENPNRITIPAIKEIRDSLEAYVGAMDPAAEKRAFYSDLFANYDKWIWKDEKKIAAYVSDYLNHKFSGYARKTIIDYWADGIPPHKLSVFIYQVLRFLGDRAVPLFWKSPFYQLSTAAGFGYCGVLDRYPEVREAVGRMHLAFPELRTIYSTFTDKIFVTRCVCGVPMFAYGGVEEYSLEYYADSKYDSHIGMHIYEGTAGDSRDWRELPDLVPFSMRTEQTEEMERYSGLYDRALAFGILRFNPDDPEDFQMVSHQDDGTVQIIHLPNNGDMGFEEYVRKDYVMASPIYKYLLEKELKKRQV